MSSDATSFVGTIPAHYDRDLGPLIFADYATDTARRVAAPGPTRVLETAAGTGIVTRRLRDLLPAGAHITATVPLRPAWPVPDQFPTGPCPTKRSRAGSRSRRACLVGRASQSR